MSNDALGDRMKMYEGFEAERRFMPLLPIVARMDGRSFSSFTKGMDRPYDADMSAAMIATCKALVEETGALMGYTQSDEITLVWYSDTLRRQTWFDGRVLKMNTALAASATLAFNEYIGKHSRLKEYAKKRPKFDARAWNVPTLEEAANSFLWRERDATKNSITMAAGAFYSHKQLQGVNGSVKQDMLMAKGVNWNNYPAFFKRGTFIQRRIVEGPFSREELDALPPLHAAHTNPDLQVRRSRILELDMPPFDKVTNRVDVIFNGAEPKTAKPVFEPFEAVVLENYEKVDNYGWTEKCIVQMIERYNIRSTTHGGQYDEPKRVPGESGDDYRSRRLSIDMQRMSHTVTDLKKVGTSLVGTIKPMGPMAGIMAEVIAGRKPIFKMRAVFLPSMTNLAKGIVDEGEIIAFDFVGTEELVTEELME